jgi:hypothetical protein
MYGLPHFVKPNDETNKAEEYVAGKEAHYHSTISFSTKHLTKQEGHYQFEY